MYIATNEIRTHVDFHESICMELEAEDYVGFSTNIFMCFNVRAEVDRLLVAVYFLWTAAAYEGEVTNSEAMGSWCM